MPLQDVNLDCAPVSGHQHTPTPKWVKPVLHNLHPFLNIQLISLHVCASNLPWTFIRWLRIPSALCTCLQVLRGNEPSTLHLFVNWIPLYHLLHLLSKCASVQGLFNFLISRQLRESRGFWPPYVNQSYDLPVRTTLCLRVSILQERHGHYENSNWRT